MFDRITKIILTIAAIFACGMLNAQTKSDIVRQRDSISVVIENETNSSKLAILYNQIAYKNLELGYNDKAISAAEKSLSYARQNGLKDLEFDNNLLLARIYSQNENKAETALYYYVAAKSGKDRKTQEGLVAIADIDNEIGLLYFNRRHYNRAAENFNSALNVFKKEDDYDRIKQTTNHLAVCSYLKGDYDNAAGYYEELNTFYQEENDNQAQKQILKRLADIYQKSKKYDKALEINHKLYNKCLNDGDTYTSINTLSNIAYCEVLSGQHIDGLNVFKQIDDIERLDSTSENMLAGTYTNIGLCYQNIGNTKACYEYLNRAIALRKKNNQMELYSQVGNILALIYLKDKDLHNAELTCIDALNAADSTKNQQLQKDAYQTYNQILQAKGEYDKALTYYQKYLNLRDSAMMHELIDARELSDDLRKLEEAEKQYSEEIVDAEITELTNRQLQLMAESERRKNELLEKDLELKEKEKNLMHQNLLLARQSELAALRDKELSDLHARSVSDSLKIKEKELAEQKRNQEIKDLENEKERQQNELNVEKAEKKVYRLIFALFGLIVVVFFVIFIIVRKKNKKLNEQKIEIEVKNADLLQKNEEIIMQKENLQMANDEIMIINDELVRQKDIIETKNKAITDSIVYAHRIQQAVCPPPDFLRSLDMDYFMFYRPKEIVSGDFYWFYQEGDIVFAVAADCTGHGVPGAFMSMLGSSLFNKIVSERKIFAPDIILNNLRNEVKKALHQDNVNSKSKDGMDLSLAKIDMKTLTLEFAAANNNGYLVRRYSSNEKELAYENIEGKDFVEETPNGFIRLVTLRADRMPIGVYIRDNESFTVKKMQLRHGDFIYLTSDGYIDQFGGKYGRKFLSYNFAKLLASINNLSMKEQYKKIVDTHEEWIGDTYSQIDDIIVFGLKL